MEVVPRISLLILVILLTVTSSHAKCRFYTRDGKPECRVERIPIGKACLGHTAFCFWPSVCDDSVKQCRIAEGDDCAGDLSNFCVPGTSCHEDMCKRIVTLDQRCDPGDVVCDASYECDHAAGHRCRRKVGGVCRKISECVTMAGIKCLYGVCRETCKADTDCVDGTKCDTLSNTCKIPAGGQCDEGNSSVCWQFSSCADGYCRIPLGGHCDSTTPDMCWTNASCSPEKLCKIPLGGHCDGTTPDQCWTNTSCSPEKLCKIPIGGQCNSTTSQHCWTFTNCSDGLCQLSDWLGNSCVSNSDCPEDLNTQCYEGQCNCIPGYYYSVSTKYCVVSCAQADLGSGFTYYYRGNIVSGVLANKMGIDVQACFDFCLSYPTCRSIDYRPGDKACYPMSNTAGEKEWSPVSNHNHYQRYCA